MRVIQSQLLKESGTTLPVIATTHAPLGCASVETSFDRPKDKFCNLELNEAGQVELEDIPWAKHGDAVGWLTSTAFDRRSGYSTEAERARRRADAFLADRLGALEDVPLALQNAQGIQAELRRTLPGDDPYWAFWMTRDGAPTPAPGGRQ